MKRSQLNKIIREEYQKILSEAFGDPIASKLQKLGGVDTRYKKFWNAAVYNQAKSFSESVSKGDIQVKHGDTAASTTEKSSAHF